MRGPGTKGSRELYGYDCCLPRSYPCTFVIRMVQVASKVMLHHPDIYIYNVYANERMSCTRNKIIRQLAICKIYFVVLLSNLLLCRGRIYQYQYSYLVTWKAPLMILVQLYQRLQLYYFHISRVMRAFLN